MISFLYWIRQKISGFHKSCNRKILFHVGVYKLRIWRIWQTQQGGLVRLLSCIPFPQKKFDFFTKVTAVVGKYSTKFVVPIDYLCSCFGETRNSPKLKLTKQCGDYWNIFHSGIFFVPGWSYVDLEFTLKDIILSLNIPISFVILIVYSIFGPSSLSGQHYSSGYQQSIIANRSSISKILIEKHQHMHLL